MIKSFDVQDINNTNEVRTFIQDLKYWAESNKREDFREAIDTAEYRGYTGPELIHEYLNFLSEFRSKLPSDLPSRFKENWDQAMKVSQESLEL